jgi:hypothetical protein
MLAVAPLSAQQTFGLVGGVATGKLAEEFDGDPRTDDDESLLSLVVGVSMQRPLSNGMIFAPEAFYVAKGYEDEDSQGKVKMNYVEIPLLLRYGIPIDGTIQPFLLGGPAIALQASCKYTDADGDTGTCDEVFGEEDSYKGFDAGLMLGGGISRDNLSATIRYDLGLANISKAANWSAKNRALMLLVGFGL